MCAARGALSRLGRIVCSGFSLCVGRHRHRRRRLAAASSSSSSRLFSASSSSSPSSTSCSAFFRSIFIQLEICCTIKRASWRFLASSQFGSDHVHAWPHAPFSLLPCHHPLTSPLYNNNKLWLFICPFLVLFFSILWHEKFHWNCFLLWGLF